MKKILKIISVFTLTSITTINISGCDFPRYSPTPIDYQQLLEDAASLIANPTFPHFSTFLKSENKTKISDFKKLIEDNISKLFNDPKNKRYFTNLTYEITNCEDKINTTTIIKIHLAISNNPAVKNCSFEATFDSLQNYMNKIMEPLVSGKAYLSINKKDIAGFYNELVAAGATFNQPNKSKSEQYLRNNSAQANKFWKEFQELGPSEEVENPLLGNVLYPLLKYIPEQVDTGLTFDNFKPYLLNVGPYNDVIAITGYEKFGDEYYEYMKIGLEGKNANNIDFNNKYEGIIFIFT